MDLALATKNNEVIWNINVNFYPVYVDGCVAEQQNRLVKAESRKLSMDLQLFMSNNLGCFQNEIESTLSIMWLL